MSARRFGRGIAAVELALVLPVLLVLLAFPLFFGRVMWHYATIEKAANDAARYLAVAPLTDMKNPARVHYAVAVANDIVAAETAELNPGTYAPVLTVNCNSAACTGFSAPSTITVTLQVQMEDPFLGGILQDAFGAATIIPLTAAVTLDYAGK
ncbi:MAG: TadE/TadG family type IV pilus assembly protein [Pseudomonadota bacterium]